MRLLAGQVKAISDLSHEVTGVRMYSFFKEEDEKWQKNHGPLVSVKHALTMWQRCGKLGHGGRRAYIRSVSQQAAGHLYNGISHRHSDQCYGWPKELPLYDFEYAFLLCGVWCATSTAPCPCRFRLWFFPRKTRYSPAEALDFLRERRVLPDEEASSSSG